MQVNLAQSPVGGSMGALAPSPAGTSMQSWLEKWSEWEIQAVVAVSFLMQVILFCFAGFRRYSVSSVLKVLLWLVYLSADAVAIYALGHMSASLSKTSTDKHQLVAFWAPFLLLHLGGQDTITAFALEDNKLWLRHLLNMFVQVAGTAYVLHKYIIAGRTTMSSAAVLVSVSGFIKYGERIWALKCASTRPSRSYGISSETLDNCFTRNKEFRTFGFIVGLAHMYHYLIIHPLVFDREGEVNDTFWNRMTVESIFDHVNGLLDQGDVSAREKRYSEETYRLIEMQLAMAYEILYTKARVIHTWYGYLMRGISFGLCFCALVAFTISKRDRYSTPDTVITFVLLGGACALEVASAFRMIGSTRTYASLRSHNWNWLACAFLFARYHLIVLKDGRWSSSVGQYNYISFCVSNRTKLIKRRMAGWIGLEDWFNTSHHTKHAKLSPALKQFVWGLLRGEKSGLVEIEDVAIRSGDWGRRLKGFNQSEELDWSLSLEFHQCLFSWHMATSTFLSDPAVKSELVDTDMAESVNTLSDYMMYLLVQHPDILPINAAESCMQFMKTYSCFLKEWRARVTMLEYPGTGDEIFRVQENARLSPRSYADKNPEYKAVADAICIVGTLLSLQLELRHKLVIIGRVWTEMLCYAATNASGDFHARQLSNGGEFLTHMLLLTTYCSEMPPIVQNGDRAAADQPESVDVPVEPTVEAAGHLELTMYNGQEEEPIVHDGGRAAAGQPESVDVPVEPTVEAAGHLELTVHNGQEEEPIVHDGGRAAADQPESVDVPVEPTVEAAGHVELTVHNGHKEEITETR